MIFLAYIELLLFAICAFTVFYLLVYAIAATGNRTDKYSESRVKHRFAILIPAYQTMTTYPIPSNHSATRIPYRLL